MGGTVLPMAIDLGTDVWVGIRDDRRIVATSENFPETGEVVADLDARSPQPEWGWVNHVVAVASILQSKGVDVPGVQVRVSGSIPPGAGLSSSASLEVALALAFDRLCSTGLTGEELAVICQQAENDFIGVSCGIMDQLAVASGVRGHALAIDCGTLNVTPVPFPDEVAVVVADSRQQRELAGSTYNERRAACETAQSILRRPLVGISADQVDESLEQLPGDLRAPARHVMTEQARVDDFVVALEAGDIARLGALMRASHESLRDDFGVTGDALDALAAAAWEAPGAIGARMTGAGFGGCTVNLVAPDLVEEFVGTVGEQYFAATGRHAQFHHVVAADGAHEVFG